MFEIVLTDPAIGHQIASVKAFKSVAGSAMTLTTALVAQASLLFLIL
jgi:hypothetical protein